jgi:hypothetical protein
LQRDTDEKDIHLEVGPLLCRRCGRHIEPFALENIGGQVQLRAGDGLIHEAVIGCLHCGTIVNWNSKRTKVLEDTNRLYMELLGILHVGKVMVEDVKIDG